ncbi:MAG: ribonuclease HI [Pirellulaceae bacterium]
MTEQPTRWVHLFTDGACSGNPGPGGWAFVLRDLQTGAEKEGSGGEPETTNNQMEMTAVIKGLQALRRPCRVTLYSDSSYVGRESINGWPDGNATAGVARRGRSSRALKNVDLWKEIDRQLQIHDVTFEHVKGHSGHEENERCDRLAVAASQQFR